MMQIPNLPNYVQTQQQLPSYNAVKIDVHNPMVNVPAQAPQIPQYIPQYAVPTMPYYSYPQATTQPYYMPPVITTPEIPQQQIPVLIPPTVAQPVPETQAQAPAPVAVQEVAPAPAQAPVAVQEVSPAPAQTPAPVVVQEVAPAPAPAPAPVIVEEVPVQPAVVPPAPVITEAPKAEEVKAEVPAAEVKPEAPVEAEKPVEVVAPEEIKPQVDLNEFLAKLTNSDYDVQAAAMEEIANMVDKEPQKATELLDSKIVDALTNLMTADSSALAGPTEAQQAARQKLFSNQQMTDDEKQLATTITPKEQVERNKSYAMFTAAILQKLYGQEYEKLTNATVPLTELPGAVTIVQQLKSNPNPIVRTSAIEALSYIQQPSYKKDLNTIFTIAQKDSDQGVQEAATAALAKLSEIPDMPEAKTQA